MRLQKFVCLVRHHKNFCNGLNYCPHSLERSWRTDMWTSKCMYEVLINTFLLVILAQPPAELCANLDLLAGKIPTLGPYCHLYHSFVSIVRASQLKGKCMFNYTSEAGIACTKGIDPYISWSHTREWMST